MKKLKFSGFCINTLLSLLTISLDFNSLILAKPTQNNSSQQLQSQAQVQRNRLIIILFTGFASQTLNQTTGMQSFLATLGQERKLSQSNLIIERRIFAWDQGSKARRYLEGLGKFDNDKLVVIGHSYGGDTAIDFANKLINQNRRVNLLVQIDSVGSGDEVLPVNAISGINYYQTVGKPKGEPIVRRSRNIDVNVAFREELIRDNSYPLNHNNIDDSQVIHRAIIQEILSLVSVQTPQASCQATVDKVLQEIRAKGVRRVYFNISKGTANQDHTGNPTNRTDQLEISLSSYSPGFNKPDQRSYNIQESILSSSVLMKSWADRIVGNCNNTAVVIFPIEQSDITVQYAIQSDGKTRERQVDQRYFKPNSAPWNFYSLP